MTLKLIDKDLRSKYAEALYKNEANYDKEINRRFDKLNVDFIRNSQIVDAGSQVFLNKVRQKRSKWAQDDLRFREHYRHVCRNVHNKKLDNIMQSYDPESVRKLDPLSQHKYDLLQQQLKHREMNLTFYNSEPNLRQIGTESVTFDEEHENDHRQNNPSRNSNANQQNTGSNASHNVHNQPTMLNHAHFKPSTIPKLPNLAHVAVENDFNDLYSRYTRSDREFIEKFPAKVELTVTDVGKQYIYNEKNKHLTLKKQKMKYNKIQTNALKDVRFKSLVSFLDQD